MGKGLESRWVEFCQGAPLGEVKAMMRLAQGIIRQRSKGIDKKVSIFTLPPHPPLLTDEPRVIDTNSEYVRPDGSEVLGVLPSTADESWPDSLTEGGEVQIHRDANGEVITPF